MNRILKYSLLSISVLSLVSCGKTKYNSTAERAGPDITTMREPFVWPDSIPNIFHVPDSIGFWDVNTGEDDGNWTIIQLWTPEQKALAQLIMSTIFDNVVVVNNRVKLAIDREDFVNQGIPEPYYDFTLEKLRNLNDLEKKGFDVKHKSMEQIWEETESTISKVLFKGHK